MRFNDWYRLRNEAVGSDDSRGWFIVSKEDDKISSGPYKTWIQAYYNTTRLQWYNKKDYYIEYGEDDGENNFISLPEDKRA